MGFALRSGFLSGSGQQLIHMRQIALCKTGFSVPAVRRRACRPHCCRASAQHHPSLRNAPATRTHISQPLFSGHHHALTHRQPVSTAAESRSVPAAPAAETDPARRNLLTAANAMRRYGWMSFWCQLVLSTVSAIILLFSVAFTNQSSTGVSLYLTLLGISAGFFSTAWAYGYTRMSRRLRAYLAAGPGKDVKRLSRNDVVVTLERGAWINVLGLGSTLLGLQATVGLLVAKTLTNATANPFLSGGSGAYNPVLALDVFLVQASTNTLFAHFLSLFFSLWLIRIVTRGTTNPGLQAAFGGRKA